MLYCGLDQSYTSTGMVILDENADLVADILLTTDKEADIYTRAADIAKQVQTEAHSHGIKKVFLEGLSFGSKGNVTRNLAGLQFLIIDYLTHSHIDFEIVAPPTLKKFATDNGRAKKDELFDAIPSPVYEHIESNYKKSKGRFDITDAYWLARYSLDHQE